MEAWRMRRVRIGLAAGAVLFLVCGAPGSTATPEQGGVANTAAGVPSGVSLERGRYLVATTGCHDCHTPFKMGPSGPEPDMSRQLSGHPASMRLGPPPKFDGGWLWAGSGTNTAFAGPWGISYAINLTPDDGTGLGKWTEDMFVQALKTGKHAGIGRPILPPMPWRPLSHMSDSDLRSIFAALRKLPPIVNPVPPAIVAPPPQGRAAPKP
jgi:hypothetical protein